MVDLISASYKCKYMGVIRAQIEYQLAKSLDAVLMAASESSQGAVSLTYDDGITADARELDVQLFRYVHASKRHSEQWRTMSIAIDNASPAMMSIANSVMVWPDNVGVIGAPQAYQE